MTARERNDRKDRTDAILGAIAFFCFILALMLWGEVFGY